MGKNTFEAAWIKDVNAFLDRLKARIRIESAIIYGSAAKNANGQWSDIDILIISDDFFNIPLLERIGLFIELKVGKAEALGYTYEELKRMADKSNSLALGALIEGKPIIESEKLREKIKKMYTRKGRAWIPIKS